MVFLLGEQSFHFGFGFGLAVEDAKHLVVPHDGPRLVGLEILNPDRWTASLTSSSEGWPKASHVADVFHVRTEPALPVR